MLARPRSDREVVAMGRAVLRRRHGLPLALAGSLATMLMVPALGASKTGTTSVRCTGSAKSCTATVALAGGGKSRRILKIQLSDTNLKLTKVTSSPKSVARGQTFQLTGGKYQLGGSVYVVTLTNNLHPPKGARVKLTFAS